MTPAFTVNDIVAYGTTGVCRIEAIREEAFLSPGETQPYYVLRSVASPSSVVHVPVNNKKLVSRMRRVLTKEEIDSMLEEVSGESPAWIEDKNERIETIRGIFAAGVQKSLLGLIRDLTARKEYQQSVGRKLYAADETALSAAKEMVAEEFCFSLGLSEKDVAPYILRHLAGETS